MNKRKIGCEMEERAISFLENQGYQILSHNYWCRFGEIDIIAKEGEYLVFIEVKYRSTTKKGTPEEAITSTKMRSITRTANYYLFSEKIPQGTPCRFDVVTFLGDEISLIRDAF